MFCEMNENMYSVKWILFSIYFCVSKFARTTKKNRSFNFTMCDLNKWTERRELLICFINSCDLIIRFQFYFIVLDILCICCCCSWRSSSSCLSWSTSICSSTSLCSSSRYLFVFYSHLWIVLNGRESKLMVELNRK